MNVIRDLGDKPRIASETVRALEGLKRYSAVMPSRAAAGCSRLHFALDILRQSPLNRSVARKFKRAVSGDAWLFPIA